MSSETGVNANVVERVVLPPEYYMEDAMDHDDYGIEDEEGPKMTHEQKLQRLREFDKQVEDKDCCPWRLEEVYPSAPAEITTLEELEEWEEAQYKRFYEARQKKQEIKERCELEKHLRDATKP